MKKSLIPDVVEVDHRMTYFWQSGADSCGHVVLVLHGFMSDYRSMEDFSENLALGDNVRVILPDLPGFGASEALEGESTLLDSYVAWAKSFVKKVAPRARKLTIIGYSFGAYVAIKYAAKYPDSLASLILITPVIKISLPVRLYSTGFDSLAEFSMETAQRLYKWQPHFDFTTLYLMRTRSKARATKLLHHRRSDLTTLQPKLVLALYAEMAGTDLLQDGPHITADVLTIMAGLDSLAVNSATRRFLKTLPGEYASVTLKSAGHLLPFGDPQRLAEAVNDNFPHGVEAKRKS